MPVWAIHHHGLGREAARHPLHERRRGAVLLAVACWVAHVGPGPRLGGVWLVLEPALAKRVVPNVIRPAETALGDGRGAEDEDCEEAAAAAQRDRVRIGTLAACWQVRLEYKQRWQTRLCDPSSIASRTRTVAPLSGMRPILIAAHRRRAFLLRHLALPTALVVGLTVGFLATRAHASVRLARLAALLCRRDLECHSPPQ